MISVIIPVHNEENVISDLLEDLKNSKNADVIVVDGKSTDKTREIVSRYPFKYVSSEKKRSLQQNEGAKAAKGDIFLFLHADCILEEGALEGIERAVRKGFVGGCLKHKIDSERIIYRFIEKSGDFRARLFKLFYGDQAIFVRKDVFFEIKGFDDVELFDDVLFSKKMKKRGLLTVLDEKVYSSPRRWQKKGIIRTTLINWIVSLGFLFNVSPAELKKLYRDVR